MDVRTSTSQGHFTPVNKGKFFRDREAMQDHQWLVSSLYGWWSHLQYQNQNWGDVEGSQNVYTLSKEESRKLVVKWSLFLPKE